MFGDEKNLKDPVKDTTSMPAPYQAAGFGSGSYTKTQKLITALYMVTDIIDRDEPLRNKLRTLGTGIISDINNTPFNALAKIAEIMSFLDIASAIGIISEMNTNILRKEFIELSQSIKESTDTKPIDKQINLSEFFDPHPTSPLLTLLKKGRSKERVSKGHHQSIGHSTRIGVQKGSTLMKALSERTGILSDSIFSHTSGFDTFRKQRREEIQNIIKTNGGNANIKDIKDKISSLPAGRQGSLIGCGEKTLQRELISMVKDGVLNKTGEKRWSRYELK